MLTSRDVAAVDRIGERVKDALIKLIQNFPRNAKSITGMHRWLGVTKTTCQRVVETVNSTNTGLEVIQKLPGPDGLEKFILAAQVKGTPDKVIAKALNAKAAFAQAIFDFAASHSALKRLILSSTEVNKGSGFYKESRKAHYSMSKQLIGENDKLLFNAYILAPNKNDPKYIEQHTLSYIIKNNIAKNTRPIMFALQPSENEVEFEQVEILKKDDMHGEEIPVFSLIEDFTSSEVINQTEFLQLGNGWAVIPYNSPPNMPIEIAALKYYPFEQKNPLYGGKPGSCVSSWIRCPTKRFFMLCFLHKNFAARSLPNAGTYSTNTKQVDMLTSPESLWFDRLHDNSELRIINSNDDFSERLGFPKANELIDTFFGITQQAKDDFQCFLLSVDYPIWSTQYRIYFQYHLEIA